MKPAIALDIKASRNVNDGLNISATAPSARESTIAKGIEMPARNSHSLGAFGACLWPQQKKEKAANAAKMSNQKERLTSLSGTSHATPIVMAARITIPTRFAIADDVPVRRENNDMDTSCHQGD